MTLGLGRFVSGEYQERVAERAMFSDIRDAQCIAEGWTYRMDISTIQYHAVDFDDAGAVATVYPRKNCPKR